jgi:hypothetical protein
MLEIAGGILIAAVAIVALLAVFGWLRSYVKYWS